jgi:hypothetical protein
MLGASIFASARPRGGCHDDNHPAQHHDGASHPDRHKVLTEGQAMAVWVAVINFHIETADPVCRAELGPIAHDYHKRLAEVMDALFEAST